VERQRKLKLLVGRDYLRPECNDFGGIDAHASDRFPKKVRIGFYLAPSTAVDNLPMTAAALASAFLVRLA
jgi:hypothetical protein